MAADEEKKRGTKMLIVFDFDWSLVNENSDIYWASKLCPELLPLLKEEIKKGSSWLASLRVLFRAAHEKGVTADAMRECLSAIPFALEMRRVIEYIQSHTAFLDTIIVSDANDMFITWILQALRIPVTTFRRIYTNRAVLDPRTGVFSVFGHYRVADEADEQFFDDLLAQSPPSSALDSFSLKKDNNMTTTTTTTTTKEITTKTEDTTEKKRLKKTRRKRTSQSNKEAEQNKAIIVHPNPRERHGCSRKEPLCPQRLCKAAVVQAYLRSCAELAVPLHYDRIVFIGDGSGDACGCLSLSRRDVVLARQDYALAKILTSPASHCLPRVIIWNADDAFDRFQEAISYHPSLL